MGRVLHLPQCAQFINVIETIGAAIILFSTGFFDFTSALHLAFLYGTAKVVAGLGWVILILKFFFNRYDQKHGTETMEKCKRDYVIGCEGYLFLTFISFGIISLPNTSMELRIAAFFAANISSFILYLAFSRPVEKIYKLEADNIGIVVEFLYVVPLIVILVLSARYGNQMQSLCILATSFLYIYPWIMNTSALLQMWMGLLKPLDNEKKPEEMRKEEEKTQQKKNSEDVESGLNSMRIDEISKEGNDSELDGTECDICCIRFDGKIPLRTPRILTECGHTYCEECIDKFLKQDKIQYAICPLCQQITVVDGGSASQLPKNYGMLKLIC